MNAKFSFNFTSEEARRPLPSKLILAQNQTETLTHIGLKLLAYLLFYRERLQVEVHLDYEDIPYLPDLVQLDYSLRPVLWVECGECSVAKLHKLAVKVPDAEIWVVKPSLASAQQLWQAMEHEQLRRDRYHLLALEAEAFQEICGLLETRNTLNWFGGSFEPSQMQFELNGLWFELNFTVLPF